MNTKLKEILIKEVKSKSQIKDLTDEFIDFLLEKYLKTCANIKNKLEKEYEQKKEKITKSKTLKKLIKILRAEIGQVYGQFLTQNFPKKDKILEKEKNTEILLELHKSSRERINYYKQIYEKIFLWYKPKKIADLACGLNPLSYPIIKEILSKDVNYFATDLNPNDMKFLNKYFQKNNIKGIAKSSNLTNLNILQDKELKTADLIFLFKALDSLEEINKNISKTLLKELECKHIVVSFPTKSIKSKEAFKNTQKGWLKKLIEENNWSYQTFEIENEIFFLIEK